MGIGMFAVAWLLLAATGSWAQTVPQADKHDTARQRIDMKPFGDSYDSDVALKISQAAIGRRLDGYQLQNRQGRTVSLSDYRGKPLMISMIYTSCFHVCPTTTRNLASAVATVRSAVGEDAFRVVTIGFDVLHDTPEKMRSYARQQGVSREKNWSFLSADQATVTRLSADLGFLYMPSSKGFDHLVQTTIVDGEGRIYRHVYGMEAEPALLTEAMKELVFGLAPATLNLTALVNRVRLFCSVYDPSSGTYRINYAMFFGMTIGVLVLTSLGIVLVRFLRYS
jgi:protein SCO1/2